MNNIKYHFKCEHFYPITKEAQAILDMKGCSICKTPLCTVCGYAIVPNDPSIIINSEGTEHMNCHFKITVKSNFLKESISLPNFSTLKLSFKVLFSRLRPSHRFSSYR